MLLQECFFGIFAEPLRVDDVYAESRWKILGGSDKERSAHNYLDQSAQLLEVSREGKRVLHASNGVRQGVPGKGFHLRQYHTNYFRHS